MIPRPPYRGCDLTSLTLTSSLLCLHTDHHKARLPLPAPEQRQRCRKCCSCPILTAKGVH